MPRGLMCLVLCAAASGCGGDAPVARRVLLISIDTCRADHVGCYGGPDGITPNIDAVAADGVVFTEAVSPAPLTRPAHATMLTGRTPPLHGVRDNAHHRLADSATTLAEVLREQGITTGAVVSAFVLDSFFGLDQGFETYDDQFANPLSEFAGDFRLGEETSERALDWLAAHGRGDFFLFLHYWDPHQEYRPPEPFASRFPGSPYSGEIAYADHCIGRVIDELKRRRLYDSTNIVITADHGEMLDEHGEKTHGYFVYQSAIRVPLIIKPAGEAIGRRVGDTVGLVDIVLTVCSLLGVPAPSEVEGLDLSGLMRGGGDEDRGRVIYSESLWPTKYGANPLISAVGGGWQLIETTRPELYDLELDPEQRVNLIGDRPRVLEALRSRLARIVDEARSAAGASDQTSLDRETRERLSSLGYMVETNVAENGEIEPGLDDPKDLVDYHRRAMQVRVLVGEQRFAEARSELERMIRERPGASRAYLDLGMLAIEQGSYGEAVGVLEACARLEPRSPFVHLELGYALSKAGASERAVASYRNAVAIDPEYGDALAKLGIELNRLGRFGEAVEPLQHAVAVNPENAEAQGALGVALARVGRAAEAEPHYREAVELAPEDPTFVNSYGLFLVVYGRPAEAVDVLEPAVAAFPARPELDFNLALALRRLGRLDEAVEHYRRVVALSPEVAAAHEALGELLYQRDEIAEAVMHFERALSLEPDAPTVLNSLAWVFATSEKIGSEDAATAVTMARRACELTGWSDPSVLDTLAAALAGVERYDEAVETAVRASALARAAGRSELAAAIDERVARYQRGENLRSGKGG